MEDPCLTATIESPTVATITGDDGTEFYGSFTDAGDSVGTEYFNTNICGYRSYAI